MQELQKKMQPYYDASAKMLQASTKQDHSLEAKAERQNKALELLKRKEFQELQKEMQQLSQTVRKFRRRPLYQGHVWLYLRKPPAEAAK
jgi:hypothetical protein